MERIECKEIKETTYTEKLENGLEVIIIPKKDVLKKYVIFGTKFGSINNTFIAPGENEPTTIPDGVAHFLEHKMFEQPNGTNSLDRLMALGIDANAYTTTDHTAYLFECTDHFYEGLDELMDYVQHPYFTEQNVEKEKGIIGQEIMMYNDDPGWQTYINAMDCMYKENPIKKDIAGSIESISKITPEILNKCYNTFYNPGNMVIVACGDFEPEKLLQEIKTRLVPSKNKGEIKRIFVEEEPQINKKEKEANMQISMPIFAIGYKDKPAQDKKEAVQRHIAIEILLNMLIGESSELYNNLYENGLLLATPDLDYEFSDQYAHILISGQSEHPETVQEKLKEAVKDLIKNGIEEEEFNIAKRKLYGNYVSEYNSVADVARMFLADWMKQINSFSYIEEFYNITEQYVENVLNEVFKEENMVISIVKENNK